MFVRPISAMMAVLIGFSLFLQYHLWIKTDGIRRLGQLKKILVQQEIENETLKKNNAALIVQINYLKGNSNAIETQARHELGMIKKDEKFYQIVK